ncbi:MAG: hypothetical protein ACKOQ6_12485 [Bacteroidota bacterium]
MERLGQTDSLGVLNCAVMLIVIILALPCDQQQGRVIGDSLLTAHLRLGELTAPHHIVDESRNIIVRDLILVQVGHRLSPFCRWLHRTLDGTDLQLG